MGSKSVITAVGSISRMLDLVGNIRNTRIMSRITVFITNIVIEEVEDGI